MRPINKRNFGPGKIAVRFINGSSIAVGYIVRQTGSSKYIVSDGVSTKTISLAPTLDIANRLGGTTPIGNISELSPYGAIFVGTSAVKQLNTAQAICFDGVRQWSVNADIPARQIGLHFTGIPSSPFWFDLSVWDDNGFWRD